MSLHPRPGLLVRSLSANTLLFIFLFVYFWLWRIFIAAWAFLYLPCTGFLLWWLLLLESVGSRLCRLQEFRSWALEHRLISCGAPLSSLMTHGIFPDQGLNLCLLHEQVDSFISEPPMKPLTPCL